jgi:hypothetical protein
MYGPKPKVWFEAFLRILLHRVPTFNPLEALCVCGGDIATLSSRVAADVEKGGASKTME